MTGKRATIIYNPMSGRSSRRAEDAREMTRLLHSRGITAQARATTGPDDATQLAREAVKDGDDIIVSYGGDGTLNEIIQSIVGTRATLAVWPGGTSNVVARDLGMPFRISQIADVIAKGKTRRIALGLAQGQEKDARYFFMMAGIGLDASIARGVNRNLKRRTGEFAYWVTGIKHLFTWQAETFVIEVDGQSYESVFALIGNGKGYGGGMRITPNAQLEEPWFEVYILPRQSGNLAYVRALAACMRGKPETTNATLIRGRHIKANSTHEPWVEADGEIIGPLPMNFDIVPDALSVIVP
ncbi:MAG: diacylglycerol kinase family protein [Blastocatellia bacterium]